MATRANPFETIESAYDYVGLLREQVDGVIREVAADVDAASGGPGRRREALCIVDYKLKQLAQQLTATSRTLNDLRSLRRLLLDERVKPASGGGASPNHVLLEP